MVYDLHNDMLTALKPQEQGAYLNNALMYALPVLAVWTTKIKNIELGFFKSAVDIAENFRIGGYAIEDAHFLSQCPLEILAEIPLRYIGLTWNCDNALAGGASEYGRLTELGKKTLMYACRHGIAIDTAHLNRESFFDVMDAHAGKILCSHTCCDAVHRHPRNLTDEQISLITERGGIVGITLESSFLSGGAASITDAVRHIDYFAQKFGVDFLALGSDFNGCNPPEGLGDYNEFTDLETELVKLGYGNKSIRKIFYENAENFFADDKVGYNGDIK